MLKKWDIKFAFHPLIWFLLLCPTLLLGEQNLDELFHSLEIAAYWDKKQTERFPITFNHTLSTGYFVTHSARMGVAGEIGIGGAWAPPYLILNGRIQPYGQLELSANYRIFRGFEDPVLGPYGFGNHADRGANVKLALWTPEHSCYRFPGFAVGIDDFIGTKPFTTYYLVGTHVFINYGIEGSLGWGYGRYSKGPSRGFFGGVDWFPYWDKSSNDWLRGIGFGAELDPTNYRKDPHPEKRTLLSQSISD